MSKTCADLSSGHHVWSVRQSLRAFGLVAPVVLVACAAQLSAEDCGDSYIHHISDLPEDFGEGHTLTYSGHKGYHNPSDAWGADEVKLQNCATGAWTRVRMAEQNEYGKDVYNYATETKAELERLKETPAGSWVSSFEQTAQKLGAKLKGAGVSDTETCGCKVFYPDLRGDKKRFEANA